MFRKSEMHLLILPVLLGILVRTSNANLAPLYKHREKVSGDYIVVLKSDANLNDAMNDIGKNGIIPIKREYHNVLNGFLANIIDEEDLTKIRERPDISYIEENGVIRALAATWNRDRVDQRNLPLDGFNNYIGTGKGVQAYIIDTGIYPQNTYFGGRASVAYDAFSGDGIDCNGHGTHCAGILGSYEYGIASEATLHGVRSLGCDGFGTTDSVIAGLDYVALNHKKPAVASLSLGIRDGSQAVDAAVRAIVQAGVPAVVSAGNDDLNACYQSPAREPMAITVGATDSADTRWSSSNYGSCLDIFAPGVDILSTWIGSTGATETLDGTSMACPHVAGAACAVLGENNNLTAYQVASILVDGATSNVITDPGYLSPNKLLYVGQDLDLQPRSTIAPPQTTARNGGPVTWNQDRVDQRNLPLDDQANFIGTGSGVNAYIIDTGIYPENTYFGGRASILYDALQGTGMDCHGHGTHCAGILGSKDYGIASGVTLYGVRVLDCQGYGTLDAVLAGMDYVRLNHKKPAVASMSLGGGISSSLDAAVRGLIQRGVMVVVAAGNENADACFTSPAREPTALTVGATDEYDWRATFSNYGRCLDIFAPGVNIMSTWIGSPYATETLDGTSMACPHVAGAACIVLGINPSLTAYQVGNILVPGATPDLIWNAGYNSPNKLLYIGSDLNLTPQPTPIYTTSNGDRIYVKMVLVILACLFSAWSIK